MTENCWGRYMVFVTGTSCTEGTYITYEKALRAAEDASVQYGLSVSIWDISVTQVVYTTSEIINKVDWQKEGF